MEVLTLWQALNATTATRSMAVEVVAVAEAMGMAVVVVVIQSLQWCWLGPGYSTAGSVVPILTPHTATLS